VPIFSFFSSFSFNPYLSCTLYTGDHEDNMLTLITSSKHLLMGSGKFCLLEMKTAPQFLPFPRFSTFQSYILESVLQTAFAIIFYFSLSFLGFNVEDMSEEQQTVFLKQHLYFVIFALFIMAFVVAAGVEESMKHFVVRCCQFPAKLKDPHSVLVYLMSAALGFATAENIEYVMNPQNGSILPGITILEGELLVLLLRILTPVHVICSVLQTARYSKVLKSFRLYFLILTHCTFYLCRC
jgi:hypothetical protein